MRNVGRLDGAAGDGLNAGGMTPTGIAPPLSARVLTASYFGGAGTPPYRFTGAAESQQAVPVRLKALCPLKADAPAAGLGGPVGADMAGWTASCSKKAERSRLGASRIVLFPGSCAGRVSGLAVNCWPSPRSDSCTARSI